jgi:hypothetical protein
MLDGVVIDDTELFNNKLQEWAQRAQPTKRSRQCSLLASLVRAIFCTASKKMASRSVRYGSALCPPISPGHGGCGT